MKISLFSLSQRPAPIRLGCFILTLLLPWLPYAAAVYIMVKDENTRTIFAMGILAIEFLFLLPCCSNFPNFSLFFSTPFSNFSILETCGSIGSLFRNWIATPLSNGSIFRNRLQPYIETLRKATLRFNGSIFRKRWFQWFPI